MFKFIRIVLVAIIFLVLAPIWVPLLIIIWAYEGVTGEEYDTNFLPDYMERKIKGKK